MTDLQEGEAGGAEFPADPDPEGPLWVSPGEWVLMPAHHPFSQATGAIAVCNPDGKRLFYTTTGRDKIEVGGLASVK